MGVHATIIGAQQAALGIMELTPAAIDQMGSALATVTTNADQVCLIISGAVRRLQGVLCNSLIAFV